MGYVTSFSLVFAISLLHAAVTLNAQAPIRLDQLLQDGVQEVQEGIYVTFDDFRNNNPALVADNEYFSSEGPNADLDEIPALNEIKVIYHGREAMLRSKEIWGYYSNGTLHLNTFVFDEFKRAKSFGDFIRVPILGTISYVTFIEVKQHRNTAPGGYNNSSPEVREKNFLLTMTDGKIHFFDIFTFRKLISEDEELAKKFKSSKEDTTSRIIIFLQEFNRRHPLYFPEAR